MAHQQWGCGPYLPLAAALTLTAFFTLLLCHLLVLSVYTVILPFICDALLTAQGGACLLCGNQNGSKRLAVDHCHNTSKVRGLLCTNCNVGIGMFRHDPELLEKAKNYLK